MRRLPLLALAALLALLGLSYFQPNPVAQNYPQSPNMSAGNGAPTDTCGSGNLYVDKVAGAVYGCGNKIWIAPNAAGFGQSVTVTLTTAQLLALNTTPVALVPAPGAGKYLFPVAYALEYDYGGTAYSTPAKTNNCFINYVGQTINSTNAPIAVTDWGTFIESTASSLFFGVTGNAAATAISLTAAENEGLQFGVPNVLTLGNGTLKVTVIYTILTA